MLIRLLDVGPGSTEICRERERERTWSRQIRWSHTPKQESESESERERDRGRGRERGVEGGVVISHPQTGVPSRFPSGKSSSLRAKVATLLKIENHKLPFCPKREGVLRKDGLQSLAGLVMSSSRELRIRVPFFL